MNNQIGLLFIYNILLFGYVFNLGFYTFHGILLIFLSLVLLLLSLKSKLYFLHFSFNLLIRYSILISIILAIILDGGYHQRPIDLIINQIFLFMALVIFISYFLDIPSKIFNLFAGKRFIFLLLIAIFLKTFILISSPSPRIDVFFALKEGPLRLWQSFDNPYAVEFTKLYPGIEPNTLGYLPATIISVLPADILFSDPRVALILAQLVFVFVIFKFIKNRQEAQLYSLLVLYHPKTLFILEQSWVDILFVALFALYLLVNSKTRLNEYIKGFILGFSLLVKLAYLPLPIFMIRSNLLKTRQLIGIALAFLTVALPFVLWSPSSFISDILLPYSDPFRNAAPIERSLNLNAFYIQNFDIGAPTFLRILGFLVLSVLIIWWQKKNYQSMLISFSAFLMTAYFFGDQAFINYYYAISLLLILSMVMESKKEA